MAQDLPRDDSHNFARDNEVKEISNLISTAAVEQSDDLDSGDADVELEQQQQDAPQAAEQSKEERSSSNSDAEQQDVGDDEKGEQSDQTGALEDEDSPISLKEVAESMDLDAKDLYEVEIPVGKDEKITLGELKDLYKESKTIKAGMAAFEEKKLSQDNEIMIARRQIDQLVEVGVKTNSLNPEVLKVLEGIHADNVARERKAVLRVMPEWEDASERESAYSDMTVLLGQYGFSRAEVEGVLDHRLLKFARDMARRENQIKKATPRGDGKVPTQTGKGHKPAKKISPLKQRIQAAKAPQATQQVKAVAISELIKRG